MNKNKWYTSLWAIALFLYLFFPVGFVLLYLRLKDKYGKYQAIGKILFWTGILWGGFGLLGMISLLTEPNFFSENFLAILFIFIIPGLICFYFGNKRVKKIKSYNKYLMYINSRREIKIDSLCNNIGVDYETAINTISEMISNEIISGYLEEDELKLKTNYDYDRNIQNSQIQNKQTKIVKCKECGAKNTIIVGNSKECEYCGTILQ